MNKSCMLSVQGMGYPVSQIVNTSVIVTLLMKIWTVDLTRDGVVYDFSGRLFKPDST